MNIPKAVYLYDEGIKNFDFRAIKDFITENFGNIKILFAELKKKAVVTRGLLFDFKATQGAFFALAHSREKDSYHIILTPKIFATFDDQKRLHIRAAIFGFPSIISTSGMVEGPAKPREYYVYKQRYSHLGIWGLEEEKIKKRFKNKFIDYDDKRVNEVLKGYIAQALFFYITEDPFCCKRHCRLYNAHWQEDLIYSQIKKGGFCKEHQELLRAIRADL